LLERCGRSAGDLLDAFRTAAPSSSLIPLPSMVSIPTAMAARTPVPEPVRSGRSRVAEVHDHDDRERDLPREGESGR
jgi:hypothetical protein